MDCIGEEGVGNEKEGERERDSLGASMRKSHTHSSHAEEVCTVGYT